VLVDILIAPLIWVGRISHAPAYFRGSLDKGGAGLLSAAFFTLNFLIAIAASPPVEVTLPAISNAVVKHIGHMSFPCY
jgi:hypothetical protein